MSRRLVLGLIVASVMLVGMPQGALATSLPTTITADQTWTAADSPYTGSSVTINPGVTVTVQPGAVIKLTGDLTVDGTLNAQGTSANPIYFTSLKDDAHGGDTNGDGAATQPGGGDWSGLALKTGSSVLDQTRVLYAGNRPTAPAGVWVTGASPQITHSTIQYNWGTGILVTSGGSPDIGYNTVSDNGDRGIAYRPDGGSGQVKIHDNLVERNTGDGISVDLSGSTIQGQSLGGNTVNQNTGKGIYFNASQYSQAIPPDIAQNTLSGNARNGIWASGLVNSSTTWNGSATMVLSATTVASGTTLTLGPGEIIKFLGNASTTVDGFLGVAGTAANPVGLTSIKDDSAGGDTNGDGSASTPAWGDWNTIYLNATNNNPAWDHVQLRYGQQLTSSGPVSLTNSTISNNLGSVSIAGGSPQITGNSFSSNGSVALRLPLGSAAGATTATVTGNTFSSDTAGIYANGGSPEIAGNTISGCTGTQPAFDGYGISYYADSSSVAGQVKIHDNTVNGCGASPTNAPAPSSFAAISVYGGFNVTGVTLSGNTVRDGGRAIDYYVNPPSTIPADIDENTLSGNASNAIWVAGDVAQSTTWENHGFAMVPRGGYNLKVDSGATLTLGAGLVVKPYPTNAVIDVYGTLNAIGTEAAPITFTSIKDDSVGGDTNGDGAASTPAPGDWDSISLGYKFGSLSGAGTFDHVNASYGSTAFKVAYAGACCDRPTTIRHAKIKHNYVGVLGTGTPGSGLPPLVQWSTIAGNVSYGVQKADAGIIAAPNVIWGGAGGPNPAGTGDQVSPNVA